MKIKSTLSLVMFLFLTISVYAREITLDVSPEFITSDTLSAEGNQAVGEIIPGYKITDWDENQAHEVLNLPNSEIKEEFLPILARFLVYGMAFVAFLIFFVAGAWLILGWGEEEEVKRSKNMIVWGVAGLAYAAASYLLVKGLLGIDLSW